MREIRHSKKLRGSCGAKNHYSGVEQLEARQPHKLEVEGSSPSHRNSYGISVLKIEYGEVAQLVSATKKQMYHAM